MRITRYAATLGALGLVLAGCSSEAGQQAEEATENAPEVAQDVEFPAGSTMAELAEAGTITVGTKFAGPYYEAGQDIMVATGNPLAIEGPDDLAGKRVCSVEGSTPAQNIRDNYPEAQLTLFDVYSKCADALRNGQVDAVTTDNVILTGLVQGGQGAFELVGNPFTQEPYGIGLTKGDDEFRGFINDTLEQAFEDGSWAAAWDRTAGAITGEPAPEPPTIDRY